MVRITKVQIPTLLFFLKKGQTGGHRAKSVISGLHKQVDFPSESALIQVLLEGRWSQQKEAEMRQAPPSSFPHLPIS